MPASIGGPDSESVSENSKGVVKNGGESSQIVLDFAISPQTRFSVVIQYRSPG